MKSIQKMSSNRLVNLWAVVALSVMGSGLCAVSAHANDVALLATVTSDAVRGVVKMSLETDSQGAIQALVYETSTGVSDRYSLAQLAQGIVLVHVQGMDVVQLTADSSFNADHGGKLNIHYLRDGMSGSHRDYPVEISRTPDTQAWALYSDDPSASPDGLPKLAPSLFFKRKRNWLGVVVGIDHIEVRPQT